MRSRTWIIAVLACAAITNPGCGKNDDADSPGRALPPPSPTWVNPAVAEGKADWHPFREPKMGEPAPQDQPPSDPEARKKEIEAEIREMIAAHNELSAKNDEEGVLEYYVEAQREAIKGLFASGKTMLGKLDEIKGALSEKLPDAKERLDAMFNPILSRGHAAIDVESITVIDDAHAEGTAPKLPIQPAYRFVKNGEDWFIEVPEAVIAAVGPMTQAGVGGMDQLLQGLRAGAIPAAAVMEALEQQLKQLAGSKLEPPTAAKDEKAPEAPPAENRGG